MMTEEVQMYLEDAKEKMEASIDHLESELLKIRAGKANPGMLTGVMVDYYGSMTPLNQVANVSAPDPRTIAIQPWEKAMIGPIEKAIMNANLGFNPDNNGELIRINIPALTEERRNDLVKQAKSECENAKISIRNARRDTNMELKKLIKDGLSEDLEKDAEAEVQKLTDGFSKKIEAMLADKEKDIMTI
ncbi:MAG: ribosome recycling factor [Marinifilaceae bacterium]